MRLRYFITVMVLAWIDCLSPAFGVDLGTPPIQNFSAKITNGHPQNWGAVQDKRGVMYFANSNGLLEYDGVRWTLIETPNRTTIRSLSLGVDGTIYFGTIGDFGYLQATPNGQVKIVSLRNLIPEKERSFNDVWQVFNTVDGTYFLTKEKIFRLYQGKITILDGKLSTSPSVIINDNLFFIDKNHGLSLIEGDQVHRLPQFTSATTQGRAVAAQLAEHEILVARTSGDMLRLNLAPLWNEKTKRYTNTSTQESLIQIFPNELNDYLRRDQAHAYRLHRINANTFGLVTLKSGVVLFDRNGKFLRSINKASGLIDNSATSIFVDSSNNLWVTTNSGISYIEYSVPQSFYGDAHGLDGVVLSAIDYENKLYIGTFQQMMVQAPFQFSFTKQTPQFVPVINGSGDVWQLITVDGDLLAAGPDGLLQIKDGTAITSLNTHNKGYCLGVSKKWPNHVFMGGSSGIDVFRKNDGKWSFVGKMKKISENIRHISEDKNGDLWLSTEINGVFQAQFSGLTPVDVAVHVFGPEQGLPKLPSSRVNHIRDKTIITTSGGIFTTDQHDGAAANATMKFIPEPNLGNFFSTSPESITNISSDGKNGYLVGTNESIVWLTPDMQNKLTPHVGPFQGLPVQDASVSIDKSGAVWVVGGRLIRVDPWAEKDYSKSFNILIRKVFNRSKRALFDGTYASKTAQFNTLSNFESTASNNNLIEIPYSDNGLTFEFSAPFFEKAHALQFRFKLDGFDENWSTWSQLATKEYTNIPAGTYSFKVQARNVYGIEGKETAYTFKVLPPWYLTIWALLLWIILGIGLLYGLIQIYTLKLKREKLQLAELVAQRTRELREATLTDPLTGLRNRRFISEILHNDTSAFIKYKNYVLASQNKRANSQEDEVFGIYLLDLDHFKQVNDTYGHEGGDQILKQFAQVLTSLVREDDVVIRLGGEEFLIVLKKAQASFVHVFAQKILEKVNSTPFTVSEGIVINKTCSIGYVSYPFDLSQPTTISFDQAIMLADLAMYAAKNAGRARAIFIEKGLHWPAGSEVISKMVASLDYALAHQYLALK